MCKCNVLEIQVHCKQGGGEQDGVRDGEYNEQEISEIKRLI